MTKTVDNTKKLIDFIASKYEAGELDDDSLVQLIELAGLYLNLKTISDYARSNKISYNGAKKYRKTVNLLGIKFIIDNY
jgi:hypothetical protein